jgi:hypothetical protein
MRGQEQSPIEKVGQFVSDLCLVDKGELTLDSVLEKPEDGLDPFIFTLRTVGLKNIDNALRINLMWNQPMIAEALEKDPTGSVNLLREKLMQELGIDKNKIGGKSVIDFYYGKI